ncbi:MAG: RagB/SusD family nutrient uptake outer membrane protein [Sphingobacteriia bacterium]|nr:RagB/SusD family nutrient uptake outer membrane protein [Sphingobacteriia bacterium]
MKFINQYKKYVPVLFFLTGTISCTKIIELDPITSVVESNFYRTETDCLQGLTAAYNVLLWDAPQNQNAPFHLISEVLADHCFTGGASVTDLQASIGNIDRATMTPNDKAASAMWYKYYFGIYRCNLLLEKLPGATYTTPGAQQRFTAEAKFLRAYYYFDLVRLYGNVPLILKPLGPTEYNQKQSAPADVYKQIAQDLTDAIGVLPRYNQMVPSELGRVTSDAARALLMRVWLYYTGYYQQNELPGVSASAIIQIGDELIKNSGHDLLAKFSDCFVLTAPYNNNNKESVFELQYSSLAYSGDYSNRINANGNLATMLWSMRSPNSGSPYAPGWSFATVDSAFVSQFDNTDARKAVTFLIPKNIGVSYTLGYQDMGVFPQKWVALKANNSAKGDPVLNYPNHFSVIRFSDVLLMASELHLLHGGSAATAQQYFERVARRSRPSSYVPPVVTLDVLYNERDLELALEGVRYWDLMRRGMDYAAKRININRGEPIISRFNTAAKGLFPIPATEILLTNNSLVQNPGYN